MNTLQTMRLRPWLGAMAIALTIYAASVAMAAEFGGHGGEGTWPSMSVNLLNQNGILIAQGLTLGGSSNRIIWQTPLLRLSGSPGISVQHGASTTFVQAGDRRIVIDNATGRSYVLADNQVWRRFPAGEPVDYTGMTRPVQPQAPTPIVTPPERHPGSTRELVKARETAVDTDAAPPGTPADNANTRVNGKENELKSISAYQQALRGLMDANNRVMVRMERLHRLEKMNATSSEIESANTDLEQARREVSAAQKRVDSFGPLPAAEPVRARTVEDVEGAPSPIRQAQLTPKQYIMLQQAEQRVLDISAEMNRSALKIQEQKERGELTAAQLTQAQRRIDAYQRDVDRANLHLQELRMAVNRPDNLPPAFQAQLGKSERDIVALNNQATRLERQLRDVEASQAQGNATEQDVRDVQAQLTSTFQKLSSASRELTDMHNAFFNAQVIEPVRAREIEPATQPAEKSAWPRATTQPAEPADSAAPGGANRNVIPGTKDLSGLRPSTGLD